MHIPCTWSLEDKFNRISRITQENTKNKIKLYYLLRKKEEEGTTAVSKCYELCVIVLKL